MTNKYDSVEIDIKELFRRQLISEKNKNVMSADSLSLFKKAIYYPMKQKWHHIQIRKGMYKQRIRLNVETRWFDTFKACWEQELGNRPIELHDYYYLMCNYRKKFQAFGLPEEYDNELFLETWQRPELVYFLFHNWFSTQTVDYSEYLSYISKRGQILEYGCGIAPITEWLCRYGRHRNIHITCADIPTLHFYFARWRFKDIPYVSTPLIDPNNDKSISGEYDVIFIIQVLEHLPRPLSVIRHLTSLLKPGGILIFDYERTDGSGLNTKVAVNQRDSVLKFITMNFDCIKGIIDPRLRDIGRPICRKNASKQTNFGRG